jgi:hypothetical protein
MHNMSRVPTPVKPVAIYSYIDRAAIWFPERAYSETLENWEQECRYLRPEYEQARFNPNYCQRIQFFGPTPRLFRWLNERDGFINQLEIAVDCVYNRPAERDDNFEYLDWHLIRRWHRIGQEILLVRGSHERDENGNRIPVTVEDIGRAETRYDAGRRAPNRIASYKESESRITGELNTLHYEWRASNRRAVESIGIERCGDLVKFDHHDFWKKRLLLVSLDIDRVARYLMHRSRRRNEDSNYTYADFRRWAYYLMNGSATIQKVLDKYGSKSKLGLRQAAVRLDSEIWLPPSTRGQSKEDTGLT